MPGYNSPPLGETMCASEDKLMPDPQVDRGFSSKLGKDAPLNDAYTILFERSPIPTWIFEAASLNFVAANDSACALYGYTREELLQRCALDVRLEEEREAARTAILAFGQVHRPQFYRNQIKADGKHLRVLTYAERISYRGVESVVEWNIDVTERELSAVELRRTQIFLDAVVESIPSMVFVKDAKDGRFVLLNKAGESLLGLSRADLIGKTDFDLFDPEDAQRFQLADQAVVASGQLVTIENEPLTTPGGLRSLRTQKIGVPDVNGNPRYLLGISEDVTEKLQIEERNRHLALHDVLTDLPNRLLFQNLLDTQDAASGDFALLLLDLDRFKAVNDRLGHHAGDELLRQVAARMLSAKQEQDLVARLGGDEFGILHRGAVSENSASRLIQTLTSLLREPFRIDGNNISISCSAGVAMQSKHGGNADTLMKRADLALYAAKTTRNGAYRWFEPSMEEEADRQRTLREELGSALEGDQFLIEYQPIVDMASGKIVCCEALLRWRHPTRGSISPAEFIPVAEAAGLIRPIGRWVMENACREAATWQDDIRIAVNLSPRQVTSELPAEVSSMLQKTGLQPDRLELEITETIFLTDSQENVRILEQLKHLGVRLALDDFGTGYSSLAYLRLVSFDKLKIDRSFITDLTTSSEDLAIVRAVIGLGKSFGASVTAEGVEGAEQYRRLRDEGCDQVQGYFIYRSMPAAMLKPILKEYRYDLE
jgi:diguanylate cyclase (GGDEF)-like protein/PAS domain S-box-containing protein